MLSGNTDNDSEFEEIHGFTAVDPLVSTRAVNGQSSQYDSGNDFEVITAADPTYGPIFNASRRLITNLKTDLTIRVQSQKALSLRKSTALFMPLLFWNALVE